MKSHMVFGFMAPPGVPGQVDEQWDREDVGSPPATLALFQDQVDKGRGHKAETKAAGDHRQRERHACPGIAPPIVAVEQQQSRQPERHRQRELALKRPQQDRPGGAKEEHQHRRDQSQPGFRASPDVNEDQDRDDEQCQRHRNLFRCVGGHPEDGQQQLRDRHRQHDDVLVVGHEKGVGREFLAVEQEGPGVLKEGHPPLGDGKGDRRDENREGEQRLRSTFLE